ncbi:MAG: BON domain-containing protein [Acidobacteria bacterium]|nr:BON domain-containing protein [Acidobacteriota bacterium]
MRTAAGTVSAGVSRAPRRSRCYAAFHHGLLALSALAFVFTANAAAAQAAVEREVTEAVRDDADVDDLVVTIAGTEATLAGRAENLWEKTRAIEAALDHDAIETVASELTVPEVEDDDEVAAGVARAIRNYVHMTVWDYIGGRVNAGVVTLVGSVSPERDKIGDLFERIAKIRGVQEIDMQVARQSSTRRDNELRSVIAFRALRHPTLSHYTQLAAVPPFRILVDNGVVTLVGVVRSDVESRLIESIARQAFETREVVNLLQVG